MRFILGPIPPPQHLDPEEEYWNPLEDPGSDEKAFVLASTLLTLPFITMAVWIMLSARSTINLHFRESPQDLVWFLIGLGLLIPLHELIHAIAYMKGLRSKRLIMGFWLLRGMFYVIYDAPMPRHRILLMSVMPFLWMSVLPAICLWWFPLPDVAQILGWFLVLIHTSLCAGDILLWWRIGIHVPRGAWIHNKGWRTYWTLNDSEMDYKKS